MTCCIRCNNLNPLSQTSGHGAQAMGSYMSEHIGVGQLDTKQQFLTPYIAICISEHSAYVYFIPNLYLISRLQAEAETL